MPRRNELVQMDDVLARIMMRDSGVGRSDEAYSEMVDGIFPAKKKFEITTVPDGDVAPYEIREHWVGVELPVRGEIGSYEPSVLVLAVDGLNALAKAGREEAREWWRDFYDQSPQRILPGILNPYAARHHAMAARIHFLGFKSTEGILSDVAPQSTRFWQRPSR